MEIQSEFIELSKEYEALKNTMKEKKKILIVLMEEMGIGTHFQDPNDNTVFQIIKPDGTFIAFDKIGYERTKRSGEIKGSMSLKKAEELGYNIK